MPIHKHALIRYHALDRCLANRRIRYDYAALKAAVDKALRAADPFSKGIGRSQFYKDLEWMQSKAGYGAEVEKYRDGGKEVYYRYTDPDFSITNSPITDLELAQLRDALQMLRQFQGLPHFEWLEETAAKLQQSTESADAQSIISFDANRYLRGIQHLGELYNAARYGKALNIAYRPFGSEEPDQLTFHPYHLKQYNNRWFAFGHCADSTRPLDTLALDRMESMQDSSRHFIPNDRIDFREYFEDLVGVTRPDGGVVEEVRLRIAASRAGYVLTKPLHESQHARPEEDGSLTVRLHLIINPELVTLLLSFGDSLQVLAPDSLRAQMAETIRQMHRLYDPSSQAPQDYL